MGNPSIEAAIKLEKKRSCFGFDTFFATDVRRFGDGGIFIGNLRKPIEQVMPKLEKKKQKKKKKLSEAAGKEVVLRFMEEKSNDIRKQVCMVQPKEEIDLQFESTKLSTPWGYVSAILLCVITFGTIALMSGFFLELDATFDDYISDVVPLFGGFLTFLGVSELSLIQYVIGPYSDDLGNVFPNAVEGEGVPVDPLAFAWLLGMVVTSLNHLPCGRLEGGRIAQALFGRNVATLLSFGTSLLLGIGGLSGSVLCLAWGLFATFFRGGEELPARDEITPLGDDRYNWGFVLAVICFLTLFPNGGGTFSSSFLSQPFFRGGL
ncbi:hypothetical protein MKW98_024456 [Papaver atlanticum]|uniref:Uncharacterized protein n=1 Tax=Papaver atlanticum TaxID=357466 RepID=A0AAD4T0X7_9MAGN|nr:hypothetical protein MKW98_024456 [Papaver atlanticum]